MVDPCNFGNPVPCLVNPGLPLTRYPCDYDDQRPIPNNTRGLITIVDNVTQINQNVFNRYKDSIMAIEGELGIQPSGTYTTVRARLDAMQETMCLIWQSIGSSSFGGGDGYAASGTATLLDGYVLVTPPGGIADDAVILFSRKTSIGDLGEITISSQDNTRFSLTSSSPYDESVINWAWFSRSSSFIEVGGSGGGDGYQPVFDHFIVGSNGQTSFTLSQNPVGNVILVFIDGIKRDPSEYSITTTSNSFLIWGNSIPLIIGDTVEVLYFVGNGSGGVSQPGVHFAGSYAVNTPTDINGVAFASIGVGNVSVGSSVSGDTWICRLSMDANSQTESTPVTFRVSYSINGGSSVAAPGATTEITFVTPSVNQQVNLEVVITGITANLLTFYPEAQGTDPIDPSCSVTRLSLVIEKA